MPLRPVEPRSPLGELTVPPDFRLDLRGGEKERKGNVKEGVNSRGKEEGDDKGRGGKGRSVPVDLG